MNGSHDSPNNGKHCRRAITLKAVRMSRKYNNAAGVNVTTLNSSREREENKDSAERKNEAIQELGSQTDSLSSLNSSRVKLNIFSTQIPQSLLMSPSENRQANSSTFQKNQQQAHPSGSRSTKQKHPINF